MPVFAGFIVGLALVAFSRIPAGVYPLRWHAESSASTPLCPRPPRRTSPPWPRRWTGRPAAPHWWPTWGGPSGTGRRLDGTTGALRQWAFGLRTRLLSRQSTPRRRPPPAVFPLPPQPGRPPPTGRGRQPSTTVSDRPHFVSATRARRSSVRSTGGGSAPLGARTWPRSRQRLSRRATPTPDTARPRLSAHAGRQHTSIRNADTTSPAKLRRPISPTQATPKAESPPACRPSAPWAFGLPAQVDPSEARNSSASFFGFRASGIRSLPSIASAVVGVKSRFMCSLRCRSGTQTSKVRSNNEPSDHHCRTTCQHCGGRFTPPVPQQALTWSR
jgi:hypothetical protein